MPFAPALGHDVLGIGERQRHVRGQVARVDMGDLALRLRC